MYKIDYNNEIIKEILFEVRKSTILNFTTTSLENESFKFLKTVKNQ